MTNKKVRIIGLLLISLVIIIMLALTDIAGYLKRQNQEKETYFPDDFYNLSTLGLLVTPYDPVTKTYIESPNSGVDSLLLLRASQINRDEELAGLNNLPSKVAIILCDEELLFENTVCIPNNFVSNDTKQSILVDKVNNLSAGYIQRGDFKYFMIPETLLNNVLRYPVLFDLVSGISTSQRFEEINLSNNAEIRRHSGISFSLEAIIFITLLNILTIALLRIFDSKIPNNFKFSTSLAPFISIILPSIIAIYAITGIPYIKKLLNAKLDNLTDIEIANIPSTFWIFAALVLILIIFYIGFEFNLLFTRFKNDVHRILVYSFDLD